MRPPTALLFPGQGSHTDTMRETVERHRPELVALALEVVGEDPFARPGEGTHLAQPAIFCASLAGYARLGEPAVELMAGHSLGEFAALVAAGALTAEDGLRLVARRGRLMQHAGERSRGGMLAVRGAGAVASALAERHGLTVANDNSPDQVVLSGALEAIEAAAAGARAEGLRAVALPVAGAFHSPLMAPAVPELEAALAAVPFAEPRCAVLCAGSAKAFEDPRRELAQGVLAPVRWRETLLALRERGAERYVETGPGKVLTGLVRKTLGSEVEAITADAPELAHA